MSEITPEQKAKIDLTKARIEKCAPIALEILRKLVAKPDLALGVDASELRAYYGKAFQEDIEPIIRAHDPKIDDVGFVMSLMLQVLDSVKEITLASYETATDKAGAIVWGVSDISDLKVSDVIRVQEAKASETKTGAVDNVA